MVNNRKSLWIYFIIAFLIPIATTIIVTLINGFPTGLVTTQIDVNAIIVLMAMVHAPTIAAMFAAFYEEGYQGIKNLFRQLKYWRFKAKWYFRAL